MSVQNVENAWQWIRIQILTECRRQKIFDPISLEKQRFLYAYVLNCNNILIDSCPGDSKLFSGQGEKAECGSIMADGRRAACGYADGSIRCEGFFILDDNLQFF